MRVYVPATTTVLEGLLESGALQPADAGALDPADEQAVRAASITAFAVTPGLRTLLTVDVPNASAPAGTEQEEELEYAAMRRAARASLRLLDLDPLARRRRVVVACDVPDDAVTVIDDQETGAVRIAGDVPLSAVASVHVDDADAEPAVAAAARVSLEADLEDPSAQDVVDDAEGFELSWYASQEIGFLLELG